MVNLKTNFQVKYFEFRVKSVMEIVYIPMLIPPMSHSWGWLYCIPRSTCVWQLRVSILHTKEHMCLTVEGVYIAYQGAHVFDSWGCLYCIPRSTCVRQLRVSILYTNEHMCLTLYVYHFIHQIDKSMGPLHLRKPWVWDCKLSLKPMVQQCYIRLFILKYALTI